MWTYLLQHFSGSCIIKPINWEVPDFRIYTDASGTGFGTVFGKLWFQGSFPEQWSNKAIAIKELVPVYLSMMMWHNIFQNSNVLFVVDNMAVVDVLNAQTASDPDIMKLLRKIVVIAMLYNVVFHSHHIIGKHNIIADAISRFQVTKAKKWAPWLAQNPLDVPRKFLPW